MEQGQNKKFNFFLCPKLVVRSAKIAYNGFGLGEGGDFHHKC